jgi:hypothetical protein
MIATRLHNFLFPSSSVHILGNHPHKRTNQMTHKHISKIGMGRQKSKRLFFSLTKFHSSSTPFSCSLNCDGLVMGVALSPPDGPASINNSKQHRLITTLQMKKTNKKTNKQRGCRELCLRLTSKVSRLKRSRPG